MYICRQIIFGLLIRFEKVLFLLTPSAIVIYMDTQNPMKVQHFHLKMLCKYRS